MKSFKNIQKIRVKSRNSKMERTRRLRTSNYMRDMVRENHVRIDELIYPIFVTEGEDIKHPVESMPGIYQYSLDRLPEEINRIKEGT